MKTAGGKVKPGRAVHIPKDLCVKLYEKVRALSSEQQDKFYTSIDLRKYKPKELSREERPLDYKRARIGCEAIGISFAELLRECKYDFDWPSDKTADMDKLLCGMSVEDMARTKEIVVALAPKTWFLEGMKLNKNPAQRIIWFLDSKVIWAKAGKLYEVRKELRSKMQSKSGRSKLTASGLNYAGGISLEEALMVAREANILPSWLIGFADGKVALLSASADSEFIIGCYTAMSEENQRLFDSILQAYTERKGATAK